MQAAEPLNKAPVTWFIPNPLNVTRVPVTPVIKEAESICGIGTKFTVEVPEVSRLVDLTVINPLSARSGTSTDNFVRAESEVLKFLDKTPPPKRTSSIQ